MLITNKFKLPQAFVEMAKQDYEIASNEYRVTSLLGGLKQTMLMRRHHHEIVVDVSEFVWMLFGTAVHHILEHQKEGDNELKEERLKIPFGDHILSGQFDLYQEPRITDYKTGSVWKIIHKDYKDWRKQLLIYAYMMKEYGFKVTQGEVITFLKDHSKSKARYDKGYPNLPVCKIKFKFSDKDFEDIEPWLRERFKEIALLEYLPDDDISPCTMDERWNDGDKFAVMKKGKKRALRVLDSEGQAKKWIIKNKKGDYIEHRPGEDKKCQDYCMCRDFCNYYQSVHVKGVIKG